MDIPYFNSKTLSDGNVYDLGDPADRLKYFQAKLGSKIEELKGFLDSTSFIGYMLAKKLAGKGTYAKMVEDILGTERIAHISVGDVIRKDHLLLEDPQASKELRDYVAQNYRGFMTIDEAVSALLNRTQDKVSVPTDFLLCLLKYEIETMGKKALFIDGLPRNMDQITASLYFRDLINYRDDPDFFILIDTPLEILNARMVNRRVCPLCHTSRNLLSNPSKFIKHDDTTGEFYYLCDNTACEGYSTARYVIKEGDLAGIETIKSRLDDDAQLMNMASKLQGVPLLCLGSTYPIDIAHDYLEDYEIQPKLKFNYDGRDVTIEKEPWIVKDDSGQDCYTMQSPVYVVNLVSQIHKLLIG